MEINKIINSSLVSLFLLNCSSTDIYNKRINFIYNSNENKLLVEAIKEMNINIKISTIKYKDTLKDFNSLYEKNIDNKLIIYFYDKKSKHFQKQDSLNKIFFGVFNYSSNLIVIKKDEFNKSNLKSKKIGILIHEIGHSLGLKHIDSITCNFMIESDDCNEYDYYQLKSLIRKINNEISEFEIKEFFMEKEYDYWKNIDYLTKNKTLYLYILID